MKTFTSITCLKRLWRFIVIFIGIFIAIIIIILYQSDKQFISSFILQKESECIHLKNIDIKYEELNERLETMSYDDKLTIDGINKYKNLLQCLESEYIYHFYQTNTNQNELKIAIITINIELNDIDDNNDKLKYYKDSRMLNIKQSNMMVFCSKYKYDLIV